MTTVNLYVGQGFTVSATPQLDDGSLGSLDSPANVFSSQPVIGSVTMNGDGKSYAVKALAQGSFNVVASGTANGVALSDHIFVNAFKPSPATKLVLTAGPVS